MVWLTNEFRTLTYHAALKRLCTQLLIFVGENISMSHQAQKLCTHAFNNCNSHDYILHPCTHIAMHVSRLIYVLFNSVTLITVLA